MGFKETMSDIGWNVKNAAKDVARTANNVWTNHKWEIIGTVVAVTPAVRGVSKAIGKQADARREAVRDSRVWDAQLGCWHQLKHHMTARETERVEARMMCGESKFQALKHEGLLRR